MPLMNQGYSMLTGPGGDAGTVEQYHPVFFPCRINACLPRLVMALIAASRFKAELWLEQTSW